MGQKKLHISKKTGPLAFMTHNFHKYQA